MERRAKKKRRGKRGREKSVRGEEGIREKACLGFLSGTEKNKSR